jgi:hypothetical protein
MTTIDDAEVRFKGIAALNEALGPAGALRVGAADSLRLRSRPWHVRDRIEGQQRYGERRSILWR